MLRGTGIPTGDPNIPWDVKRAKELGRKIDERVHKVTLSDDEQGFDDENDIP